MDTGMGMGMDMGMNMNMNMMNMNMNMNMNVNVNMNMNMNPMNAPPPIMSKEQFEAGKVDLGRKCEIEILGER